MVGDKEKILLQRQVIYLNQRIDELEDKLKRYEELVGILSKYEEYIISHFKGSNICCNK